MSKAPDVLIVRSEDASYGVPENYHVVFPSQYNGVTRVDLLSCELPVTFNAVSYPYLAGITFTYASVAHALPGFACTPSAPQLAVLLQAWLATAIPAMGTVGVSYATPYNVFTITWTGGGALSASLDGTGRAGEVWGLTATVTSSSGVLSFQGACNINPHTALLVKISNLAAGLSCTNMQNAFFRIPLDAQPGGIIFYNAGDSVSNVVRLASASIAALDVSLSDLFGNQISLRGQHWHMTLGFSYT